MGVTARRCDMHSEKNRLSLTHLLGVLAITSVLASCGGSSGDSNSQAESDNSSGGFNIRSTGGGSSTSSGTTVLFEQPTESGIIGNLFVPLATDTALPKGVFELVLWQPNPNTSNGQLMATEWDAGSVTGFTPSDPLSTTQLGFQNKPGTSTAQMDDDTVGAYINSADLPFSPVGQKMMISPQFTFMPGNEPVPFLNANSSLSASMDLQIPTAVGSDTYVVADFVFQDQNGVRISYGVVLFSNGGANPTIASGYDAPSKSYRLDSPLGVEQQFVTNVQGGASATGTPWLGWQHFEWSISQPQFVAALSYMAAQFPDEVRSTDPTQYALAEIHLNAEFHFQPAPAELGWSMRGWKVWVTGSSD
jgi:hypothetical protein